MSYVEKVTDFFLSRCRGVTILSPADYTMIAEWEKQAIPLPIILNSINEVCDKLDGNEVEIESVSEFQETVKKNFGSWLQTMAET